MLTTLDGTKRLDISHQTKNFKELCQSWQGVRTSLKVFLVLARRRSIAPMDVKRSLGLFE